MLQVNWEMRSPEVLQTIVGHLSSGCFLLQLLQDHCRTEYQVALATGHHLNPNTPSMHYPLIVSPVPLWLSLDTLLVRIAEAIHAADVRTGGALAKVTLLRAECASEEGMTEEHL
jgi:hypothetical protein